MDRDKIHHYRQKYLNFPSTGKILHEHLHTIHERKHYVSSQEQFLSTRHRHVDTVIANTILKKGSTDPFLRICTFEIFFSSFLVDCACQDSQNDASRCQGGLYQPGSILVPVCQDRCRAQAIYEGGSPGTKDT